MVVGEVRPGLIEKNTPTMKKLLAVGFLSLAMLGVANAPAFAIGHLLHFHCCDRCCSYICCRQYNAFTPVCFGNITCVGCCPFGNCGLQAPSFQSAGYPGGDCCDACADGYCPGGSCGEGCVSSVLPPATNKKGTANGNAPNFTPPMPTPVDGNPMPTSMLRQNYWGNRVMPAGYQPMYYPGYGYYPQMPMRYPTAPQPAMNAFSGGN
jgi:hypothetical protein